MYLSACCRVVNDGGWQVYLSRASAVVRFIQGATNTATGLRGDWLIHNLYGSMWEVQHGATAWLWMYSNKRPNMALDGVIPRWK